MMITLTCAAVAVCSAAGKHPVDPTLNDVSDPLAIGSRSPLGMTTVFDSDTLKTCTRIRTPYIETSGGDFYHLWAICCGDNACGNKEMDTFGTGALGDDHKDATVIMTTSSDRGLTWGKTQHLTGKGYANAKAIFDESRNTLVVQYSQYDPSKIYQIMSKDHGKSWSKQEEIKIATECGGGGGGGGGQRTMSIKGRMIWYSDSPPCIWYSDDGGKTYNATKIRHELDQEVSFVALSQHTIYGNGRSSNEAWAPNRIDYKSFDNGMRWTVEKSELKDPVTRGTIRQTACGLATGTVNKAHNISTIYQSEPAGIPGSEKECPGRSCARAKLTVSCSLDGGSTWPYSIVVNGNNRAEYSSIKYRTGHLLIAWGYLDNFDHTVGEHILSTAISISWCKGA